MNVSSIRSRRLARGWSQEQLARHAGLSRPAVSAIETGRVDPSVSAALALAQAFDCRVEDLFWVGRRKHGAKTQWAWPAPADRSPFWKAALGGRVLLYPFEPTLAGILSPDGFADGSREESHGLSDPQHTLVIAACDPAIGLLLAEMARISSVRGLPLTRSSRAALDLLGEGLVHVAGLHLQDAREPGGNERVVREVLGDGYSLLRVCRWQEGLALRPELHIQSIREALSSKLRWVGRETGSGARRCLDAILERRRRPEGYDRIAHDHMGVAETIRTGWAEAGVCVQLTAVGAGLRFLPIQEEDVDLCYRTDTEDDPRIQALLQVVRSRQFRNLLRELPGYDCAHTGGLQRVTRS